jgi:hypothetical protein
MPKIPLKINKVKSDFFSKANAKVMQQPMFRLNIDIPEYLDQKLRKEAARDRVSKKAVLYRILHKHYNFYDEEMKKSS